MTGIKFLYYRTIKSAGVTPILGLIQYATFKAGYMIGNVQITFGQF